MISISWCKTHSFFIFVEVIDQFKLQNTIRSLLVAPKEKLYKEDKYRTINHIECKCLDIYVLETGRALKKRNPEHKRGNSSVTTYSNTKGHAVDLEGVRILDLETNWHCRGIKESIHIRMKGSTIKWDQGIHHLPSIYNI